MTGSPEQLGLPGMPRPRLRCTPSRLATFADCPRRYRFTYVDRPAPARGLPWAHNTVGAAVHLALRQWWEAPPAHRNPAHGRHLLAVAWTDDGFRDAGQSRATLAAAQDWVADYLATQDPAVPPVAVEYTVAAGTAGLTLSGRVDRLDRRGTDLVVVDYKTGRHQPEPADAAQSPALALYVLGVRATFHAGCDRVELHHLPTGRVAAFTHTAVTLAEHVARAEAVADGITEAAAEAAAGVDVDLAYPPRPAGRCRWCDFQRHCPDGRHAAPAVPSWSGLSA